jgi:hypothetical protein
MPEKQQVGQDGGREYEAPTLLDLGAVDRFSQGDSQLSIDDE